MSNSNAGSSNVDSELTWLPQGYGFVPPGDAPAELYGPEYWAEYQRRDATVIGERLTAARYSLVRSFTTPRLGADIGIGGGAYVQASGGWGHDVNPLALDWLDDRGSTWNQSTVDHLTFWDSIEHIEDPAALLRQAEQLVFLSTPIYRDAAHCQASKHFKPGEHVWYFTHEGLQFFMRGYDFELLAYNRVESDLGREDIGTYVFRRLRP